MSPLLKTLENEVQIAALVFLAVVYMIRIIWLMRFKSRRERTFAAGSEKAGVRYSLANIAMPWAMESTRKRPGFYLQFVVFHLGVAAAIAATFIIPYAPGLFTNQPLVWIFRVVICVACLVGLLRLYRRLTDRRIRLISTADDFVSLVLMICFFAAGVIVLPNNYQKSEWPLILFFGLTAFFLIYVPFSKIGHYLYYPFIRTILGRTLGHRGVFPPKKGSRRDQTAGDRRKSP